MQSSSDVQKTPGAFDHTSKTDRAYCYKFRDIFLSCLDKHRIYIESPQELRPRECRWELNDFRAACPKLWVEVAVSNRASKIRQELRVATYEELSQRKYGRSMLGTEDSQKQ